ncbi:MAG: hypothetical protein ACRERX_10030 [Pseudomonas sp.]
MHRSGRSLGSLAKEFGLADQTVRNWIKQAELDAGKRSDGILSKAAAWFARETDAVPPKSRIHERSPGLLPDYHHVPRS